MNIDCDALDPDRWKSQLFLSVYQRFVPIDLTRDQAWQLAVFMNTKGFLREHFFALFHWTRHEMNERVDTVLEFFKDEPSLHRAAYKNVESISMADGLAWLKAVLEIRPGYQGTVPLWTQLALQALNKDDGLTQGDICERLNIDKTTPVISRWMNTTLFDPLTAEPIIL